MVPDREEQNIKLEKFNDTEALLHDTHLTP